MKEALGELYTLGLGITITKSAGEELLRQEVCRGDLAAVRCLAKQLLISMIRRACENGILLVRAEENNQVKVLQFLLSVAQSLSVMSTVLESTAANNRIEAVQLLNMGRVRILLQ